MLRNLSGQLFLRVVLWVDAARDACDATHDAVN